MRLRSLLGTAEPIISLWCWAAENATNGDLSGFSIEEIEHAADWRGEQGKAFKALCDAGFIDNLSDGVSANKVLLHEWGDTAGARISSYLQRNQKQRDLMRKRRSGSGDSDPRPEEVREKKVANSLALTDVPMSQPGKLSPYTVVSTFLAIRAQVIGGTRGVENPFARPHPKELEKAEKWLDGMTAEEARYIEPAIRLACQHVVDGASGWTHEAITKAGFLLSCIISNWRDLCEELQGVAPAASNAFPQGSGQRARPEPGLSPEARRKYGIDPPLQGAKS